MEANISKEYIRNGKWKTGMGPPGKRHLRAKEKNERTRKHHDMILVAEESRAGVST